MSTSTLLFSSHVLSVKRVSFFISFLRCSPGVFDSLRILQNYTESFAACLDIRFLRIIMSSPTAPRRVAMYSRRVTNLVTDDRPRIACNPSCVLMMSYQIIYMPTMKKRARRTDVTDSVFVSLSTVPEDSNRVRSEASFQSLKG